MLLSRKSSTLFHELFQFNTLYRISRELNIVSNQRVLCMTNTHLLKLETTAVSACFYHQNNKNSKPRLIDRLATSTSDNFHKTRLDGKARIDETRKKVQQAKQVVKERLEGIKENVWTIPNALCITRIALTPLLSYFVVSSQFGIALSIFAIAGITDLVSVHVQSILINYFILFLDGRLYCKKLS